MTNPLLKIASTPAATVEDHATVRDAVDAMARSNTGAVAVLADCKIVGVFTERDLLEKVVRAGLDPAATKVADVMAPSPVCVSPSTHRDKAIEIMLEHRFRHLPIADEDGCLIGMLSLRDLLGHQLTRLREEVNSLAMYLAADGPGG
jgi:CBS domain-containing protein